MPTAHPSRRATAFLVALGTLVASACSDLSTHDPAAPDLVPAFAAVPQEAMQRAMSAQERHTEALMRIPGVVGTAVTVLPNGRPAIRVFLANPGVAGLPATVEGHPVSPLVSGPFHIIANPRTKARPAPLGFSVGHPQITAGTIGFRVRDGSNNIHILSNNHVLANSNNASIGDAILQPGPSDGGTSADQIGTLSAFQTILFNGSNNTMDAAIARVNSADLLGSTPTDDGYGAPSTTIWGDGNNDGTFDNVGNLLNVQVTKYGRTTELTVGTITGVNATVDVCYSGFIFCTRSARFTDQLIVGQSGFSQGGDSGSGVVTVSGLQPVGLLFAGSSSQTILNRIDHVLKRFNVVIDVGGDPPPPPETRDLAIEAVSTASPATEGQSQNVAVTVKNVGNVQITDDFTVTLVDATTGADIGETLVTTDLAGGVSTTVDFSWTPTEPVNANHTLSASHDLSDDNGANDAGTTVVFVNAPDNGGGGDPSQMHVGDLDGSATSSGPNWQAHVSVLVVDGTGTPVVGASVSGAWSEGTTDSGSCTTGSNGRCSITSPQMHKRVGSAVFTIDAVSKSGMTYVPGSNTDPDGDSNGTTITVVR